MYDGGGLTVRANQQQRNDSWVMLGTYPLAADSSGYVSSERKRTEDALGQREAQ